MPIAELENFRRKYPDYGDMSDAELAGKLAAKYPEAYGDLPDKIGGEPTGDLVKKAVPEGASIGSKIYEMILGRPKGDYLKSVGEAANIMGAQPEGDTLTARAINDYLAEKGYPNVGAAAATIADLPFSVGRNVMGAMGTALEATYVPTAIRHVTGAAGDVVEYGTGSPVAGDVAANALNYPAQFLAPGGMSRLGQIGLQKGLPKLSAAGDAMKAYLTDKFGETLGGKIIAANQQKMMAQQAFDELGNARLPMKETLRALDSALAAEVEAPSGAAGTLELLKKVIESKGGGLSPQEL